MKALVKTYLNIRTDHPAIELDNNPGYYDPGEEIEVLGTVIGQPYKGNSIWYRLTNNAFVWSGGIDGVEFTWNTDTFEQLNSQQQNEVLLLAKEYYTDHMISDDYGVTGIFIGKKKRAGTDMDLLSLSFQVKSKSDQHGFKTIPPFLPFKGFAIPTDVVEDDYMEMQFVFPGDGLRGKPGGSLSRIDQADWGSCAFIAENEADGFVNYYLVTNYHVAAFDLLLQNRCSYDVAKHDEFLHLVMPSWQADSNEENKIGFLYKGLFDEWHDTALIRIPGDTDISNLLDENVRIDSVVDIIDDVSFIGQAVTMYGGFSGAVTGKRIVSVNSSQRGRINGEIFTKSELIQVERMSHGGDSGSPVMIGDQLIGIIIGADKNNTYVLSADKILSFFNLKLSTK
ncbi:MAG: hypothetical protein Q7T76_04335 [Ferruginibacter sp.]|nr:hypothetical protein [Ferruginibacter sp.]